MMSRFPTELEVEENGTLAAADPLISIVVNGSHYCYH